MLLFKRSLLVLVVILSWILGTGLLAPEESKWQLKKYEDGISVYTRDAANSAFKELKAVYRLKTSLASIVAIIQDYETYPEWVYRCGASKTLKTISETELIHYQTVVAPWPATDRDFVVHVKVSQDPVTKVVTQTTKVMPTYIPEMPDHVRIKEFKATWTLTPTLDGYVNLEYQLLVDPGGNVPAWMVNMAVVDGPFETNVAMKKRVFLPKYQQAKLNYIKELR